MKNRTAIYSTAYTASFTFLMGVASSAFALDTQTAKTAVGTKNISLQNNLLETASTIINWVLAAAFLGAVGMLIIGGFRYVTSAGNSGLADSAKETITNAIIGLVFILLAFVIASTINTIFTTQAPKA